MNKKEIIFCTATALMGLGAVGIGLVKSKNNKKNKRRVDILIRVNTLDECIKSVKQDIALAEQDWKTNTCEERNERILNRLSYFNKLLGKYEAEKDTLEKEYNELLK